MLKNKLALINNNQLTYLICYCLLLIFVIFNHGNGFAATKKIHISIAVSKELYTELITNEETIPCKDITFTKKYSNSFRGLGNLIIICRALEKSSFDVTISLILTSGYQRSILLSQYGTADISTETVWGSDINKDLFYFTDSMFKQNNIFKGIYTLKDHPLQKISLERLNMKEYIGITVRDWIYDLDALKTLTPNITVASSYEAVYKILKAGKADFSLLSFSSTDDLAIIKDNITLMPIKKIKVPIGNSRHFVIAKKRPNSRELIDALNRGLNVIRDNGELDLIYQKSGIKNISVKNWHSLTVNGID